MKLFWAADKSLDCLGHRIWAQIDRNRDDNSVKNVPFNGVCQMLAAPDKCTDFPCFFLLQKRLKLGKLHVPELQSSSLDVTFKRY